MFIFHTFLIWYQANTFFTFQKISNNFSVLWIFLYKCRHFLIDNEKIWDLFFFIVYIVYDGTWLIAYVCTSWYVCISKCVKGLYWKRSQHTFVHHSYTYTIHISKYCTTTNLMKHFNMKNSKILNLVICQVEILKIEKFYNSTRWKLALWTKKFKSDFTALKNQVFQSENSRAFHSIQEEIFCRFYSICAKNLMKTKGIQVFSGDKFCFSLSDTVKTRKKIIYKRTSVSHECTLYKIRSMEKSDWEKN